MKVFEFILILILVIGICASATLNRWHITLDTEFEGIHAAKGLVKQEQKQEQNLEQNQRPGQDLMSDMLVTRQEFLVVLAQSIGLKPEYGAVHFVDIYDNSPDLQYIYPLFERGIITGFPDGTVRPHEYITINEAEIIKARALNITVPQSSDTSNYLTRKQMYNILLDLTASEKNRDFGKRTQ